MFFDCPVEAKRRREKKCDAMPKGKREESEIFLNTLRSASSAEMKGKSIMKERTASFFAQEIISLRFIFNK